MNTKEIREAAETVTQQPLGNVFQLNHDDGEIEWLVQEREGGDYATCQRKSVAQMIALLDPATVLALCDAADDGAEKDKRIAELKQELINWRMAARSEADERNKYVKELESALDEAMKEKERLRERVKELEPLAEKGRELNEMIENIKEALGPNEELKPRVMQKTPKWP